MPAMIIKFHSRDEAVPAWPDLDKDNIIYLGDQSQPIEIVVLDHGMTKGHPSVAIRLDLPDGNTVITETSARLFCSLARAVEARYPMLFKDN